MSHKEKIHTTLYSAPSGQGGRDALFRSPSLPFSLSRSPSSTHSAIRRSIRTDAVAATDDAFSKCHRGPTAAAERSRRRAPAMNARTHARLAPAERCGIRWKAEIAREGQGRGADCSVCMVNFQCWGEGMKMRIRSTARQDSHRSYAARRLKFCCGVINDATSSNLGANVLLYRSAREDQ